MLLIILIPLQAITQNDDPPTRSEMQAQMKQAVNGFKKQITGLEKKIADAKKNKEDPESISRMEKQLQSVKQMVSMLEKTDISGNKPSGTLSASKNDEPAYISPFTPINLKQPVAIPTWEQAKDKLLWYRGRRIDANTLISPSGLVVRYNRQTNILTFQPGEPDTIYYGLVNTLGQVKQLKLDYSKRMENMMNSFFMFPLIEESYKEYDLFKTRFYQLAKNNVQLPQQTVFPRLEIDIRKLLNDMLNLPSVITIPPPKRPNDLCLCVDVAKRTKYENELANWGKDFFEEEKKIIWDLQKIIAHIDFNKRNNYYLPPNSLIIEENYAHYFTKFFDRMKTKLTELANQYEQGDVLIEDGLVLSFITFLTYMTELDVKNSPTFRTTAAPVYTILAKIQMLVPSDIFERYIEQQKSLKNFNAVFDYGLYTSHEMNKKMVSLNTNVNNDLYDKWMDGLKKFNRFSLTIDFDFDYQQVDKNDKAKMVANGVLESDGHIYVSLGRRNCQWELYLTDVKHSKQNTAEADFKIPMKIINGTKDYIDDDKPQLTYTGPTHMKLIFPTFKINFCGDESVAMMDLLSYLPSDLQKHSRDRASDVYTIDMLAYASKMFSGAKKTEVDVNKLISTSVDMINLQSSQLPQPTGDPAFDRLKMDYLMNKKKHDLQFSLSQTTHTGKTVIKLTKNSSHPAVLFDLTVDLADPNDEDRKIGIMLIHGNVKLRLLHVPIK